MLFRNNDSALPLIDLFERNGIPYNCRKFDGVYFSHRIVTDITDIINFACDPHDADAFMRVYYKFESPLSKKAAVYACEQSKRSGKPILEELVKFPELGKYAKEGVIKLLTVLPMVAESNATKAIQLIWDTAGYGQYVISKRLDAGKYTTLCLLAEKEHTPKDLLRRLSELRELIRSHVNSTANKMTLSTIHSSKGLEYERVFLLDILDATLPSNAMPDSTSQEEIKLYEEDRRLYYVGMTRAKNELFIFNCQNTDSAFTDEILRSLPREIVDENSVMAVFKQGLCNRSYIHHHHGKGTVVAQCGYSALVEYESGQLQLLTNQQLFEQRDMTVTYAAPKPIKKKSAPKEKQKFSLSVEEQERLLAKATVGRTVIHNKFGRGIISKSDGRYITICFDDTPGEKKFDLILATENGNLSF